MHLPSFPYKPTSYRICILWLGLASVSVCYSPQEQREPMPAFPVFTYYLPTLSSQTQLAREFSFCEDKEVVETAKPENLHLLT